MTNPTSYTDEQVREAWLKGQKFDRLADWSIAKMGWNAAMAYLDTERQRLQAEVEALRPDADRLNWLALQHVEVRTPARYGSVACFLGTPEDDEVFGDQPWGIRAEIDAARATPNETKEAKS